jgi:hypothetical protein
VSASSFRVGRQIVKDLVDKADEQHTNGRGPGRPWDTNDLADFVEGVVFGGLEEFERLRPEAIEYHVLHSRRARE